MSDIASIGLLHEPSGNVASSCAQRGADPIFVRQPQKVVFVVPAATLALLGQTDAVDALAHPIPGRQWPHALAALSVRNYRLFLSAQVIGTTGLWMQRIAQDWLVLELSGSVAAVGIAVALQFLPVLVFGLFGGVIADRYPKRRLLMITQTTAATLAATLGLLALTGTAQVWQPDPPGVRRRTGRRPPRSQRGQPQLIGVPVRCACWSRALRDSDPCGRPGLVVPDQRRLLPRGGEHAGGHPAEARNGDGN